jgi:hypothetical protein
MAIYFAAYRRSAPLRGRMAYLMLVLLVITSAGLMGCGGAVSTQSTQVAPSTSITVTATSGGISKTPTVSFNVK